MSNLSYNADTIDWTFVELIDKWLDDKVSADYHNQPLAQNWARVAKVSEELGEAINELILMTGQNPRKGTDVLAWPRLIDELADTAITAILAIEHFTKEPLATRNAIRARLEYLYRRMANGQ